MQTAVTQITGSNMTETAIRLIQEANLTIGVQEIFVKNKILPS